MLHQNYPNPFNPITTLRYDLPEDSFVKVVVYDMSGNQVKTLINDEDKAGSRSVQWNATNNHGQPVSAGVYVYTIEAGDFIDTRKMILPNDKILHNFTFHHCWLYILRRKRGRLPCYLCTCMRNGWSYPAAMIAMLEMPELQIIHLVNVAV